MPNPIVPYLQWYKHVCSTGGFRMFAAQEDKGSQIYLLMRMKGKNITVYHTGLTFKRECCLLF